MFPTTVWTTIARAGGRDVAALQEFAGRYRPAVLRFVRSRGFGEPEAEDVCQEVFVRLLAGDVLAKADRSRGRFRSLLSTVTLRTIQDRLRRRPDPIPADVADTPAREGEREAFDRTWAWNIVERAIESLRASSSPYYQVIRGQLAGEAQDRNRLWIARRKLSAEIRREVAATCRSRAEMEEELATLAPYLRPS